MIDKVFYINLEHRTDRKESVLKELKKIGIIDEKIERIDAVKTNPGWIGCSLSHIKTLENAIENDYETVMIVEDDIIFNDDIDKKKFNELIENLEKDFPNFDICSLTCSVYGKKVSKLNSYLSKAINIKTTTGYIIKKKFYKKLHEKFSKCAEMLKKGQPYSYWAIDERWKELQGEDSEFYLFDPILAKQQVGYSDIMKKNIKYTF